MSTIFCGALAGKISRIRPKRNSSYHKDRVPVALAVFSAVEVRDMRGWNPAEHFLTLRVCLVRLGILLFLLGGCGFSGFFDLEVPMKYNAPPLFQ